MQESEIISNIYKLLYTECISIWGVFNSNGYTTEDFHKRYNEKFRQSISFDAFKEILGKVHFCTSSNENDKSFVSKISINVLAEEAKVMSGKLAIEIEDYEAVIANAYAMQGNEEPSFCKGDIGKTAYVISCILQKHFSGKNKYTKQELLESTKGYVTSECMDVIIGLLCRNSVIGGDDKVGYKIPVMFFQSHQIG